LVRGKARRLGGFGTIVGGTKAGNPSKKEEKEVGGARKTGLREEEGVQKKRKD